MRFNSKKTKSRVVSRSCIYSPSNGYLTLGGVELEEVIKELRILGLTLDSKLMFETLLRKVVSKAVRSLGVVSRAGKLFDCLCMLKSCFTAYVLSILEYCASV